MGKRFKQILRAFEEEKKSNSFYEPKSSHKGGGCYHYKATYPTPQQKKGSISNKFGIVEVIFGPMNYTDIIAFEGMDKTF